ncbi:MAG TPA: zf-HC2 domain-containing protein [Streptosporangiaceae bacterium]|nr:zf-HC2 domain-containing protein [Streptosporangiaceae bacterium]
MSRHVDAESLARYAEGLLGRRGAARVRTHLSGCAACSRTAAQLTGVSARLSQVPVPPIPSAVAARVDAALSAETARAAAPGPAAPGTPDPAPAPRPPRRNPLWSPAALRILAATGVTLVVAGGIGYAVAQSGSSGPSSAPARAVAPSPRHSAVKGGPDLHSNFGAPDNNPGGIMPSSRYVRSGTDYRRGTLARQAVLVAARGQAGKEPVASLPPSVGACVRGIARHHPVSTVDLARYDQRPAVVIVLGGHPGKVIAVSYSCAELDSAPLTVTSAPGAG